jgi:hypothetical protein
MTAYDLTNWHASLRRNEAAIRHADTGEVRVPLALLRLDERSGEVDLVLSRRECEQLHGALGRLIAGQSAAVCTVR